MNEGSSESTGSTSRSSTPGKVARSPFDGILFPCDSPLEIDHACKRRERAGEQR